MAIEQTVEAKRAIPTRYLILLIIFIVTAVNYADRATLSIAGTDVAKELQLDSVSMGYIFSAFGWAYLLLQTRLHLQPLFLVALHFPAGFCRCIPPRLGRGVDVYHALYARFF